MNRLWNSNDAIFSRVPRASGDEPQKGIACDGVNECSPRQRG